MTPRRARRSLSAALALVAVAVAGAAAACAGSAKQFKGQDGSVDWWTIRCPGGRSRCVELANERCPGGYQVKRDARDESSEMDIRCRGASAPAPTVASDCQFKLNNGCDEQEDARRRWGALEDAGAK